MVYIRSKWGYMVYIRSKWGIDKIYIRSKWGIDGIYYRSKWEIDGKYTLHATQKLANVFRLTFSLVYIYKFTVC